MLGLIYAPQVLQVYFWIIFQVLAQIPHHIEPGGIHPPVPQHALE